VLYGTDFPFANEARLRTAEAAFDALPLTAQEQAMIRCQNASALFETFAGRCCGTGAAR
jgi:hypothetical protein